MSTTTDGEKLATGDYNTIPNIDDEEVHVAKCGIGKFKPTALRMCAVMPVFTGVYSISGLLTSTLTSYVNSQVTTLERHFGFNSAQTGLIMAANDIGFLVVVLFVSYFAAQVHIPRALGFVTVLFGVSGIVCALPQFLFGAPSPLTSSNDVMGSNVTRMTNVKSSSSFVGQICDGINDTSLNCDVMSSGVTKIAESVDSANPARVNANAALVIIVVGMILQGVAKTPRSSFTTTYVDANVDRVKTGFYMGIIISLGIMGPALAFAIGGLFTRIYVTLEETTMSYRHPNWVGAWWLGYVVFGSAACIFAIPLFCFPRQIKGSNRKKRDTTLKKEKTNVFMFVKGFVQALLRLLTNPVYMCYVLATCFLLFSVAGSQSFTTKYIENQFAFPVWKSNLSMAAMMLSTACLGTFLGGYLTKRFKMGPMISLKFIVVMQFLACVCSSVQILFKCDQPRLYNSPGPLASEDARIEGCIAGCGCEDTDYFPVCGDDGKSFFSPCHAGCQDIMDGSYVNCTCITGGTAVAGMCDYGCDMFYPFIVFVCAAGLLGTFSIIPRLIVCIRAVEERDKPLALGFNSFLVSVTGWMVGPIVFGKLIDGICIQWENSCTRTGSCRLYDNDSFRLKLIGYMALFRGLAFVFTLLTYVSARVTKKFEKYETAENGVETLMMLNVGDNEDRSPDKEAIGH